MTYTGCRLPVFSSHYAANYWFGPCRRDPTGFTMRRVPLGDRLGPLQVSVRHWSRHLLINVSNIMYIVFPADHGVLVHFFVRLSVLPLSLPARSPSVSSLFSSSSPSRRLFLPLCGKPLVWPMPAGPYRPHYAASPSRGSARPITGICSALEPTPAYIIMYYID